MDCATGPVNLADVSPEFTPLGIALGGGAARGLCHIGVLKVLSSRGIKFPVVTGTSMGAIVGAAYVCGKLAEVERIARSITARTMSGWADVNLRSGALKGDAVKTVFRQFIGDTTFESLRERGIRFAVAAADLDQEEPVYIDEGRVDDAVRASMSVPGIFEPIIIGGRVLVDGGLIDNVPVDAARALGAGKVIGVEAHNPHDIWLRTVLGVSFSVIQAREVKERLQELAREQHVTWQRSLAAYRGMSSRLTRPDRMSEFMSRLHIGNLREGAGRPRNGDGWTALRATLAALDIIASLLEKGRTPFRSSSPADLFIRPDVRRFHAHQFYRASQLVFAGELAAIEALPRIEGFLVSRRGRHDAERS